MVSIFISNGLNEDIKICYSKAISEDEDELIEIDRITYGCGKRIEIPEDKFIHILSLKELSLEEFNIINNRKADYPMQPYDEYPINAKCKNKPITEHGVECECGSMLSNGERIYCYLHSQENKLQMNSDRNVITSIKPNRESGSPELNLRLGTGCIEENKR